MAYGVLQVWLAMKATVRNDHDISINQSKQDNAYEAPIRIPWTGRVLAALKNTALMVEILKLLAFVAVSIDVVLTSARIDAWTKDMVFFTLMFAPAGAACVKVSKNMTIQLSLLNVSSFTACSG